MRANPNACFLLALLVIQADLHAGEGPQAGPDSGAATNVSEGHQRPFDPAGSILPLWEGAGRIEDSTARTADYRYAGDLLRSVPGLFMRDLGSPGQFDQPALDGLEGRAVLFLLDGVPQNDPLTGAFDMHIFPTEAVKRIEYVTGPRAFLYGAGAAGGAVNVVSKERKALHPYSRIRYSESGHGFGFIDGTVSQNVSRSVNATAGGRHGTTAGRFSNSDYDAWAGGLRLRVDAGERLSVVGSAGVTVSQLGLNGGVDTDTTPADLRFDELQAIVRNSDAYEKNTRYAVRLAASLVGEQDSLEYSTASVFLTSGLREYRDEENRPSPNGIFIQDDHRTQLGGVVASHRRSMGPGSLELGGELRSQAVIESPATGQRRETIAGLSGKAEAPLAGGLVSAFYARAERALDRMPLSWGADLRLPLGAFGVRAGVSRSHRFPSLQERLWNGSDTGSTLVSTDAEVHTLVEAGIAWQPGPPAEADLRLFRRNIGEAVPFPGADPPAPKGGLLPRRTEVLEGAAGSLRIRCRPFLFEGKAMYLQAAAGGPRRLPRWSASGGAYFRDRLFDGHLDLKTGFQGSAFSAYDGAGFDARAQEYVPDPGSEIPSAGTADFVLFAEIGDAVVHFIWQNLLDRKYVVTSFYPMPERSVRFGISWDFLD